MTTLDDHREALRAAPDLDAHLLENSGLPGRHADLELARAAALEADAADIRRWAGLGPAAAPAGAPHEFLAICGVLGLGRLAACGDSEALAELRGHAQDPRPRLREAVATALQWFGESHFDALLAEMWDWSDGSPLERRAAVAALCEPPLLREPGRAAEALRLLDGVTASLAQEEDRRAYGFKALRRALGYGWSVAVAADPEEGMPAFERWLDTEDRDLAWVMRENLRKDRLDQLGDGWADDARARLAAAWGQE